MSKNPVIHLYKPMNLAGLSAKSIVNSFARHVGTIARMPPGGEGSFHVATPDRYDHDKIGF